MTAADVYDSFALYGSGVTLVAVGDGDQDRFFVAASVLTASVDPFTVAVSVGRDRDALAPMTSGVGWSMSLLAARHADLVRHLTAGPRQRRREALELAGAQRSPEGSLWLPDALVTLWCTTRSSVPIGDQLLLIGDVVRSSDPNRDEPLLRWNRDFVTTADLAERELLAERYRVS